MVVDKEEDKEEDGDNLFLLSLELTLH